MKILINISVFLFLSFYSFNSYTQTTFGVRGGLNLANMSVDSEYIDSDNFSNLYGFHIGPTMDYRFTENSEDFYLSLETGLFFNIKGFKWDEYLDYGYDYKMSYLKTDDYKVNLTTTLYYLDLPITLKGTYDINSNGFKVFGMAGPYLGYGLSGTFKTEFRGEEETEDIEWGDGEDAMFKRFDYGLTFGGGIEIKSIEIGISYDLGLANIASDSDDEDIKGKNKILKFFVGYRFNK